jgi:hypothetical protein
VICNGVRKDKPFFVRLYTTSEIEQMINDAGMKVQKILSGYNSKQLTNESSRMVIVARKP